MKHDGERKQDAARGFTLLELMIVIFIIFILAALGAGRYEQTLVRARESVLHQDLAEMRKAIQNYTLDKETGPTGLDDLVSAHYLREVPTDPMTKRKDWVTESCTELMSAEQALGGICDVHSSSEAVSPFENTPYSSW